MNKDKEEFINRLRHIREFADVSAIRVKTQCRLCGDSKKDPNKKRFYILCDPIDSEPVKYICFNCGAYGMLTADILAEIIGPDAEEIPLLKRINKTSLHDSGTARVNKYRNDRVIPVIIPPPRKTDSTVQKIRYLNSRIGYNIPVEDYNQLKLVFSIAEFLQVNKISVIEKFKNLIPLYDRDYIGWLSVKNEYLLLRDITGKNKYRYVKYNIFGMEDNAHSFYTISNGVNTISQENIDIVVAEGPFDILSVVYNLYGGIKKDCVFMSTNHGQFYHPLLYYFNKGLVGSNIYLDIYRDSDSIVDYWVLQNQIKIYTKNYRVFRNRIGKDFGVPKNEFEIEEEF